MIKLDMQKLFGKGHASWMKGRKGLQVWHNISGLIMDGSTMRGKKHTEKAKEKNRQAHLGKPSGNKGKHQSIEARIKIGLFHRGKKRTLESRRKQGNSIRGEKSYLWKGGLSKLYKSERALIMQTIDYKLWRASVFERDRYTCINCKTRGGKLEADHIKPWLLFPKIRYHINNGRTLCKKCHKKIGWSLFKEKNPRKAIVEA